MKKLIKLLLIFFKMPYAHMKDMYENQKETGESPYTAEVNGNRIICGRCYKKNINSLVLTPENERKNYLHEPAYCEIIKGEKACVDCLKKNPKRTTKTKAQLQEEIDNYKKTIVDLTNIIKNLKEKLKTRE